MTRALFIRLSILLAAITGTAGVAAGADNLLVNDEFETWTNGAPSHWTTDGFTTTRSGEGEGHGEVGHAVILEKTGDETAWLYQYPSEPPRCVPFREGQHVRFTVWLKLHPDSPAPGGGLSIRAGSVSGPPPRSPLIASNRRTAQPVKDKYTKYEVVHTIQPGTKSFFATLTAEAPVKVYVDGAVMEFTDQGPTPEPIGYLHPEPPEINLPDYQGQAYEAVVPDTLDLAAMAKLAVHGLTSVTDPAADHEIYWRVRMQDKRPVMSRDVNHQVQLIMHRSLVFNRLISGSRENMNVEKRWMEMPFQMQGPDGLLYYPLGGRPWIHYTKNSMGQYDDFVGDQDTGPLNNGWSVEILGLHYELTGDERFKELGKKVVDGMAAQAIHRDDYAFYSRGMYGLGEKIDPAAPIPDEWCKRAVLGWLVCDLVYFYRSTGYQPALTLAGELARFVVKHAGAFDADGVWLGNRHHAWHGGAMMGLLEYAIQTEDKEMLELVRKAYEYAKQPEQHGNVLTGWFPENCQASGQLGEICGAAFMIRIALRLTRAGAGDYWDDVDRWTRNHLAEGQLTHCEWMYPEGKEHLPPVTKAVSWTDDDVGRKNIGDFAGWPSPNDFFGHRQAHGGNEIFMHCCSGEGATALYRVWENILDCKDGKLRVNLLLNRASPWADVDSSIPYQGRVDVRVKKPCELSVRIPEWVTPGETKCRLNGDDRSLSWDGRYAVVGTVRPKDVVALTFPISERTDVVHIQGKQYTLIRKGNDVVHVDPPGKYCPLYQRDKYRDDKVHTKKTTRFVADRQLRGNSD